MSLATSLGYVRPIRNRSVRRPAAEALVDAASTSRLLVVGSSRRHGSQLAALGPVCHDVLLNITGPTVIVHPTNSMAASGDSMAEGGSPATRQRQDGRGT
jgi:nucleotide-binding universal stress UspA family protein